MSEFKRGDLVVRLTNQGTAFPQVPDTGQQITGRTSYQWFSGGQAISGATGATLGNRLLDGTTYSCKVTYTADQASVPQSVKLGNNPAETTFSIVASAGQVTECPDGSYVPVGQECGEGGGECGTPIFESSSISPGGQLAAANGTSKSLSFTITYRGFLNKDIKVKSVNGIAWGAQTPAETFSPQSYTTDQGVVNVSSNISGDVCTFSGSFSAPFDGVAKDIVKSYIVRLNIVFECGGDTSIASPTAGGASIKWGDAKGETTPPECKYDGFFIGPSGCGSYISQVTDTSTGVVKYYAVGVRDSTDPDDFVGEWTVTNPIFNCDICPSRDCPNATITRVSVSPPNPKIGETVSVTVTANIDKKGYNTISDTTAYRLEGDGIPCITILGGTNCSRFQSTGVFTVGPFTSNGIKNLTAGYANSYQDPNNKCTEGGFGYFAASRSFTIDVGGADEPPKEDPTIDPILNMTISGPQRLKLGTNGQVTGNYNAGYSEIPNGWVSNNQAPFYKFSGQSSFGSSSAFSRTFTQAGLYTVGVTGTTFFCQPAIDKACTPQNTAPYSTCESPYCRKSVTGNAGINVVIEEADGTGPEPDSPDPSGPGPDFNCLTSTPGTTGYSVCCDATSSLFGTQTCISALNNLAAQGLECCDNTGGPDPSGPGPDPSGPDPSGPPPEGCTTNAQNACCDPSSPYYSTTPPGGFISCASIRGALAYAGAPCCSDGGSNPDPSGPDPSGPDPSGPEPSDPGPGPGPGPLTGQPPTVSGVSTSYSPSCDGGSGITVDLTFTYTMGTGDYQSTGISTTSTAWTCSGGTCRAQRRNLVAGNYTVGTCAIFTGSNASKAGNEVKDCTGTLAYTVPKCTSGPGPGPGPDTPQPTCTPQTYLCCDPNYIYYNTIMPFINCPYQRSILSQNGVPCC